MGEEMAAFDVNETQKLGAFLEGRKPSGCKWMYKVKHNFDQRLS